MKKKLPLSGFTMVMLAVLAAALVYCFIYLIPVQNDMNALRGEIAVAAAEADIYGQYIADPESLLADIEAAEQEIAQLHADGYINDSNVSFRIGDAIQRYHVSLTSVTLQEVMGFDGNRVLPINVVMTGELQNVLDFISYFENDDEGSYLVRGSSIEMAANTAKVSLTIFLCTPDM